MPTVTTADPARKHRMRWLTLVVLSLSLLVIVVDNTIVNVALPTLQRELGASASGLQWIVDAYVLVFAGLLLTMGTLGDRFGRKRALQTGLVLFALASAGAAYADSTGALITARALMGVGGALIMPSTLSVIVGVFPRGERAKAIGVWTGVAALGVPLGPVAGGWLLEHYWHGAVFLIGVPIAAAALLAGLALVPESRDPHATRVDAVGAGLSTGMLASLVFAIIEAPARGWGDGLVLTGFAAAAVLGTAFTWWERRVESPMLDLRLLANPRFSVSAGVILMASLAMGGFVFLLTQYLQLVQGHTPLEAGVRVLPLVAGFVIGAGSGGRLTPRLGAKRMVTAGMLITGAGLALGSTIEPESAYGLIAATLVIMGAGMGASIVPSTDAVLASVPEAKAGVGSAVNDTARQVGFALGVGILGSAMSTVYGAQMADAAAGLPTVVTDSVGAAMHIAATLPAPAGAALAAAAQSAFIAGMGLASLTGAGLAVVTAVLAAWRLPHRDAGHGADADSGPAA
jgi:EmrB/QacA subfamily drug resistance transporter